MAGAIGSLSPMTNRTATTFVFTDLASDGGKAPEWVQLLPPGPAIAARDGRRWTYSPATILSAFAANRGPLAIDYEHGQDILADKGGKAPAAGWIVDLEERSGSIWGKVEWTAAAAQEIAAREYRFLSPSMRHTADGVLTRLAGAGLVNRPALEMTALSREDLSTSETKMDFKAIAKALGLAETADQAAILAAIASRNDERAALCKALSLDDKVDASALATALTKLTDDHKSALARLEDGGDVEALRTSLASLQEELNTGKIDKLLDDAQAAGKITPASRETYAAICKEEGGIERFTALVKTLPVIAAPSGLGAEIPTTGEAGADDPVALASAARKYQDEQAALGNSISTAQAVLHVKATK